MKKAIAVAITDTHLSDSTIELNKSIFRQAVEITIQLGLNSIEHVGDVFQSRKSQSQAVLTAFGEILDDLREHEIGLNCVVGNHDKTSYSDAKSFLDPFKHHPALDIYPYCGARFTAPINIPGRIGIHYASYFNDEQYIKMIQEKDEIGGFAERNILLTHVGCTGAVMNNGTKIESTINSNLFSKYDKVFIGHYHDPQQFDHIEYIGAAMQHNFGEGTQKGATVIYDDLSTELVPFIFPQYLTYEVDVKSMTTKDIEDLKVEKQQSQDYIRVTLKGAEKDLKAFNKTSLESIGIKVQLQQEEIKIEELEARIEPFDSKTLTEEFEVFCKKNKLNHKEGLKYFNQIVNS